jgi:hypothetical protein
VHATVGPDDEADGHFCGFIDFIKQRVGRGKGLRRLVCGAASTSGVTDVSKLGSVNFGFAYARLAGSERNLE